MGRIAKGRSFSMGRTDQALPRKSALPGDLAAAGFFVASMVVSIAWSAGRSYYRLDQ